MKNPLSKAVAAQLICSEGDTVPDLLAWTKSQPNSRLPATYNRPGNVWETLMAFRDERLAALPEIITQETIEYLLESGDKKDWMFYAILCWIVESYDTWGMNEAKNKADILARFMAVQNSKSAAA